MQTRTRLAEHIWEVTKTRWIWFRINSYADFSEIFINSVAVFSNLVNIWGFSYNPCSRGCSRCRCRTIFVSCPKIWIDNFRIEIQNRKPVHRYRLVNIEELLVFQRFNSPLQRKSRSDSRTITHTVPHRYQSNLIQFNPLPQCPPKPHHRRPLPRRIRLRSKPPKMAPKNQRKRKWRGGRGRRCVS
jgi:hypothetical protein